MLRRVAQTRADGQRYRVGADRTRDAGGASGRSVFGAAGAAFESLARSFGTRGNDGAFGTSGNADDPRTHSVVWSSSKSAERRVGLFGTVPLWANGQGDGNHPHGCCPVRRKGSRA